MALRADWSLRSLRKSAVSFQLSAVSERSANSVEHRKFFVDIYPLSGLSLRCAVSTFSASEREYVRTSSAVPMRLWRSWDSKPLNINPVSLHFGIADFLAYFQDRIERDFKGRRVYRARKADDEPWSVRQNPRTIQKQNTGKHSTKHRIRYS